MKQLDIDNSVQHPFIIRQDAEEQSEKYWPTFNQVKQTIASRLKILVSSAYFRSKVYMNSREKFIVIKVDRPHMADKLQNGDQLSNLNNFVLENNIEVVCTKNNLLFRIYK